MKKIHALFFLGAFLLVAGLGARYYAYPRLAVIPSDLDSKVVAENPPGEPATYFSIAELSEVSGELGNQTQARVDPVATRELAAGLGRDVLVVRTYACTDDIAVDCATMRYPLSAALSTFAVDRRTGEPVAWEDASIETGGSVESGVIISATSVQDSYAALDGDKVLTITDGTFTTPDSAADATVATYRPLSKALYAVRVLVPLVGAVAGTLLIALALLLVVRRRRRQARSAAPVHITSTASALAHVR